MKTLVAYLKNNIKGIFLLLLLVANVVLLYYLTEWEDNKPHKYLTLSEGEAPMAEVETGQAFRASQRKALGFQAPKKDQKKEQELAAVQRIHDFICDKEQEEQALASIDRTLRSKDAFDIMGKLEAWVKQVEEGPHQEARKAKKIRWLFKNQPKPTELPEVLKKALKAIPREHVERIIEQFKYSKKQHLDKAKGNRHVLYTLMSLIGLHQTNALINLATTFLALYQPGFDLIDWGEKQFQKLNYHTNGYSSLIILFIASTISGTEKLDQYFTAMFSPGFKTLWNSFKTRIKHPWTGFTTGYGGRSNIFEPNYRASTMLFTTLANFICPFRMPYEVRLGLILGTVCLLVACYAIEKWLKGSWLRDHLTLQNVGRIYLMTGLCSLFVEVLLRFGFARYCNPKLSFIEFYNTYVYGNGVISLGVSGLTHDEWSLAYVGDHIFLGCINMLYSIVNVGSLSTKPLFFLCVSDVLSVLSWVWTVGIDRFQQPSNFVADRHAWNTVFQAMKALCEDEALKDEPLLQPIRGFVEQHQDSNLYRCLHALEGAPTYPVMDAFLQIFTGIPAYQEYIRCMYGEHEQQDQDRDNDQNQDKDEATDKNQQKNKADESEKARKEAAKRWKVALASLSDLMPVQKKTGYAQIDWETHKHSQHHPGVAQRPYYNLVGLSNPEQNQNNTSNEDHKEAPQYNVKVGVNHGVTLMSGLPEPMLKFFKTFINGIYLDGRYIGMIYAESAKINPADAIFAIDGNKTHSQTAAKLNQAYRYARENPDKAVLVIALNPFVRSSLAARSTYAYCKKFNELRNTTALFYAPYPELDTLAASDNFGYYHVRHDAKKDTAASVSLVKGKWEEDIKATISQLDPDARKELVSAAVKDPNFLTRYHLKDVVPNDYTKPLLLFFTLLWILIALFIFFNKRKII